MTELFIKPIWGEVFQYIQYGRLHHLALGGGDSGKTNLWLWMLENLPSYFRIIVINSLGHLEFKNHCDIKVDETQITRLEDGLNKTDGSNKYKYHKINLEFREKIRSDLSEMRFHFDEVCKILMSYEDKVYTKYMRKKHNKKVGKDFLRQARIILLVDELIDFCDGEKILPHHLRILREGRNHGIIHIGNAQRSQGISKWILTQSKTKYLFEIDKYDVHRLTGKIENIEKIGELYPYHFMVVHGLTRTHKHYYKPCPKMKE